MIGSYVYNSPRKPPGRCGLGGFSLDSRDSTRVRLNGQTQSDRRCDIPPIGSWFRRALSSTADAPPGALESASLNQGSTKCL